VGVALLARQVPVVEEEGVVLIDEGGRQTGGAGRDGHVGAVAECLGQTAADRLGAVGTGAPHVAGVVGPLQHALRTRHVGWQSHPVSEHLLLLRVEGDGEDGFARSGYVQRISAKVQK